MYSGFLTFNDQLWMIGGIRDERDSAYSTNDVWSSSDGINWAQATPNAGFVIRNDSGCVVFNNQMWIVGGYCPEFSGTTNDVWSSSDGTNWAQATANAGFLGRENLSLLVFNNQMWVIGGSSDGGNANDVWCSSDGTNWTQATAAAEWLWHWGISSTVFDNKMWIMGGQVTNDVWYSSNGTNWTMATATAAWIARAEAVCVTANNRMWLMGGNDSDLNFYTNDVWWSTDGINWTEVTNSAAWVSRASFNAVVFSNKLWVANGCSYAPIIFTTNDVWSSTLTSIPASTSITLASQADGLTVNKSILPTASNQYSLGSQAYPYKDLYLDTNSVFMGGVKVLSYDPVTTSLVSSVPIVQVTTNNVTNATMTAVAAGNNASVAASTNGSTITYTVSAGNGYSTNAGYASVAGQATNAQYASVAGSATNAQYASVAGSSTNAQYASVAGSATNAQNSGYATNAGYASVANQATNANYATSAGTAATATNAQYASVAGTATNASYASVANQSTNAQYATIANTASNVNSALTGTNTFNSLLMLSNNAIMWDDMLSSAQAAFQSGTADITNNDTLGGKMFLTSATTSAANDHLTFTFQTPHRRKSNSDLKPHIHFWQSAADQTNCWFALYTFTALGSTNEVEVQVGPAVNDIAFTSSNMHQLASFPDIPGTGKGISSILRFKLYRFGARGSGSITVTDCDCHYQIDGFGSEQPSSKSY
jgi:hypothetical protein